MIDPQSVRQVVAILPNWLGDAVMCTPALRALRRQFPNSRLVVAGRSGICALLEDLPGLDACHPLPEKPGLLQMLALARELRRSGAAVVVVFPHSFRAALLAWLMRGAERVGYRRNGRSWMFTRSLAPHRENGKIVPVYMVEEYLGLVKMLGAADDGLGPELGISPRILEAVEEQLSGDGPLVGIAPGAAFGPSKRWLPEYFAEAASQLAEQCGARCVLLTGPGEEAIGNAVKQHARVSFIEPRVSGQGVAVLKAAISRLDLLICNDSGARHVATALRRPVICIMGSTSPSYTDGPYEIGQVVRLPLACSPCQQPVCPLDHHRCMRDILPEQVVQAGLPYLTHISQPKVGME